jgi:Methyltransferase domain
MTSPPSQFRRLPPRRILRDRLKRLYFAIYKLGVRLGVYILPAHYYVSEPNIMELERTVDLWANPSAMSGVDVDLDEQIDNLRRVCAPFQKEFYGNPHYRHAVNQPFGSGRSRTFGYIEAQVLHAVVRHYEPARLIEIGGGVPTYCTYQAMSMNRRDTGVDSRITCIEPHPIDMIKNLDESSDNVELIARPIQEVPLEYFTQLRANDIVFIDTNHVVRSGSEVNYIVLEILPIIPKGVLVHFHDIYLPYDYDRDVLRNFIHPNETALVAAFLACNTRYKILFALSMLHYERRQEMQSVLPGTIPSPTGEACALASTMTRSTSRLRCGCALRCRRATGCPRRLDGRPDRDRVAAALRAACRRNPPQAQHPHRPSPVQPLAAILP